MTVSVILVPYDESQPLVTHLVSWDINHSTFEHDIAHLLNSQCCRDYHFETAPLLRPRCRSRSSTNEKNENTQAGLYAYYHIPSRRHARSLRNVRATRLAMACGLHSLRFYGPVLLVRSYFGCRTNYENLSINEVWGACCISPDLRLSIQHDIASKMGRIKDGNHDNNNNEGGGGIAVPEWLADAAQQNYHDEAELNKVIQAMNPPDGGEVVDDYDEDEIDDEDSDDNDSGGSDDNDEQNIGEKNNTKMRHSVVTLFRSSCSLTDINNAINTTEFVAKIPLCIHCRRSSTATTVVQLCDVCEGVYFCSNNCCKEDGWSHDCLCLTWSIYTLLHRRQLSRFNNNTFGNWQKMLTSRPYQLSDEPYEMFMHSLLLGKEVKDDAELSSWWYTEMGGWSGGHSTSASHVDVTIRMSYKQGFAPIVDIPEECRITDNDVTRCCCSVADHSLPIRTNNVGLLTLSSWQEYYTLRNIPPSSPVCLLLTFPLTIYHAIEKYGEVPVTVAKMLDRPLRIHVVGAEKEINFLDMFKEVMFLLPEDIKVCDMTLTVMLFFVAAIYWSLVIISHLHTIRFCLPACLILLLLAGTCPCG